MPVDFSLLPPAKEVPSNPPSRFIWTVAFFVLTVVGIFLVLMLWPKGRSTQTPGFWFELIFFPTAIAGLMVLHRYRVYLGDRQDAIDDNSAREQHVLRIFEIASRPLGVLASTYYYSADARENGLAGLLSGRITLETQQLPTPDAAPMKARWLAPVIDEQKVKPSTDQERQMQLMEWLFNQFLIDVAETIRALPSALRLTVHLNVCGVVTAAEAKKTWQRCWKEHKFSDSVLVRELMTTDLMLLDTWLDRTDVPDSQEARLMIFVQLNNLLKKIPPVDSAEAGVALLIVPEALIKQHQLPIVAQIHRPMEGKFDAIPHVLEYALKWGKSTLSDVVRTWQTGIGVDRSGLLTANMVETEIPMPFSDLDKSVGIAGNVAPWLALACAVAAVKSDSRVQLVAYANQDNLQLACCRSVAKK